VLKLTTQVIVIRATVSSTLLILAMTMPVRADEGQDRIRDCVMNHVSEDSECADAMHFFVKKMLAAMASGDRDSRCAAMVNVAILEVGMGEKENNMNFMSKGRDMIDSVTGQCDNPYRASAEKLRDTINNH
jgi:hypothetical protein